MTPSRLWQERLRSFEKARRSFRSGSPEGLHDLRVALRRIAATAGALGHAELRRDARRAARALSPLRQLEVDRRLLARVASLGFLSAERAAALDARWSEIAKESAGNSRDRVRGKRARRLKRSLVKKSSRPAPQAFEKLVAQRRKTEALLSGPAAFSDRALHRYRIGVKTARYLAEDLTTLGATGWERAIEKEKKLQETLGRWNDLRLFRERLIESRGEAETRGVVTLVLDLDRLVRTLDETVASARRDAERAVRSQAKVVPLAGRSA